LIEAHHDESNHAAPERSSSASSNDRNTRRDRPNRDSGRDEPAVTLRDATTPLSAAELSVEAPQQKLQSLINTLTEHQQYQAQRRELKNEDEELSKKQSALRRNMERLISSRQSQLTELGVETADQLEEQLGRKKEHHQLESKIHGLDERIRSILGTHVSYDAIARLLENTPANELEKRWDTLGTRTSGAEERIAQLLQRQGEIGQEMKTLAADKRLAEAKLELACLERQIHACAEHWRTLGVTTCMLEKVCEIYESERQPETLREASSFLKQLTEGKYVRVWTPLGKNALRIDNEKGQSLPLEVLSRGTREAVFISLRLSLAAAYSRRGVTLPLVLDDVLVNFDTIRATSAAKVLRDFAALGHQVVMFTCHEHIMRLFDDIGVQVRVLPNQGHPGEATVYHPGIAAKATSVQPVVMIEEVPEPEVVQPEPDPIVMPVRPRLIPSKIALVDAPEIIAIPAREERVVKVESVVDEEMPATLPMWFDYELPEESRTPAIDTASRVWAELDAFPMPLEGEPHDAWWEEHAAESSWVEP
jgi:hypothetical protein